MNESENYLRKIAILLMGIARIELNSYPRSELSDWVEILANGNPEEWKDVIDVALEDMEVENAGRL